MTIITKVSLDKTYYNNFQWILIDSDEGDVRRLAAQWWTIINKVSLDIKTYYNNFLWILMDSDESDGCTVDSHYKS